MRSTRVTKGTLLIVAALTLQAFAANAADGDFVWAKQIGGADEEHFTSIAVDSAGYVYMRGEFTGTVDFDPGPEVFELTSTVNEDLGFSIVKPDIFILKLDSTGNFVWAKQMLGTIADYTNGVALDRPYRSGFDSIMVDGAGNVYTTGWFAQSVDINPGPETFILTSANSVRIFVSKLDSSGNFVWGKDLGSPYTGNNYHIAVDNAGNLYFMYTPGMINTTPTPARSIEKFDSAGNLVWEKHIDCWSNEDEEIYTGVDGYGNVYATGRLLDTVDFDPGPGTFNLTAAAHYDIFLTKLDSSGNFVWAKAIHGTEFNSGIGSGVGTEGIVVDGVGNVYCRGWFSGTVDFDPGPDLFKLTVTGNISDFFVSKFDTNGNFVWAQQMARSGGDREFVVDRAGNAYMLGSSWLKLALAMNPETLNLTVSYLYDTFVSKFDSDGNFVWTKNISRAKAFDDTSYDIGWAIAADGAGNVYAAGEFKGTVDFDPGPGTFKLTAAGEKDIFVLKLAGPGGAGEDKGNTDGAKAVGAVDEGEDKGDFDWRTWVSCALACLRWF